MVSTCLIIGDPVNHSLSPRMHNAGYLVCNIADSYVFGACRVAKENLAGAIAGVRALGIRGVSVTIPHKESVLALLDFVDQTALTIGAVNTIVNNNGSLFGYNTDYLGIAEPLRLQVELEGASILILGAGGAAKAAAVGLSQAGAKITVANRTVDRAAMLAELVNGEVCEYSELQAAVENNMVIINCTALGMSPDTEACLINEEWLQPHHIVFDTVYAPRETVLLRRAAARGTRIIEGLEMLLEQGLRQFELYTGVPAPREAMWAALIGGQQK